MKIHSKTIFTGFLLLILLINPIIILGTPSIPANILISLVLLGIPGLLLLSALKIRNINPWEYFVYTIGLSVAFIMFSGLAINWLLPRLNITDKPLSTIPLLLSFDVAFSLLGTIAYMRNRDIALEIKFPRLDRLNKFFIIAPVVLLTLSVLGAMIQNNGGSNILSMMMLGETAAYFFLAVSFRDKLNSNVYPWAILWISLSLLLSNSLRGWHLIGWDISQEYEVFQLTSSFGHWAFSNFENAYNACLSLTILPSVLSTFLKINPEYIFKLIVQLIFSTLPLGLYILFRRYSTVLAAFLGSMLFIFQEWFMHEVTTYVRQELALFFFVLSILVLFNKKISKTPRNMLALIFGFSTVVSHYSTAYIALFLFLFAYLVNLFMRAIFKDKGRIHHISGVFVLSLIAFTIIWNGFVTSNFQNLVDFARANIFTWSNISVSAIMDHLNGRAAFGNLNLSPEDGFPMGKLIINISRLSKIIVMGFIVLAGAWVTLKKKIILAKINLEYKILCFGSLLTILIALAFPAVENYYGLTRIYAQAFILLAFPAVLAGVYLLRIFSKKYIYLFCAFVILSFLYSSGLIFQYFGGDAYVSLNNSGKDYAEFYTLDTEVKAARWMARNYDPQAPVCADVVASLRLWGYAGIDNINQHLLPPSIGKDAYVYLSHTNFTRNKAFAMDGIYHISYNAPTDFLNQNKNLIYDNGGSAIFK
jgi:uncharacterized membrane protein